MFPFSLTYYSSSTVATADLVDYTPEMLAFALLPILYFTVNKQSLAKPDTFHTPPVEVRSPKLEVPDTSKMISGGSDVTCTTNPT